MNSPAAADVISLHASDNVCVAAKPISKGTTVTANANQVIATSNIKPGHKIATVNLPQGTPILKYGQVIGFATADIAAGEHVHSHNLQIGDIVNDYAAATEIPEPPKPLIGKTFQGYRRPNGKAGTRNYVAVISTVNCSASVSKYITQRFDHDQLKQYPNIDGVIAFTHQSGCGMQYQGDAHATLNRVLGGIAKHPNIGAYLLIGLGCEAAPMGYLLQDQNLVQIDGVPNNNADAPIVLSMQDEGGTVKTVEKGIRLLSELLPKANDVERVTIDASELILGLECGGSDGNSGITANPAVGVASNMLVAAGGTPILAETSEIYGAEHLLTRRSVNKEVAQKLIDRIQWWKDYVAMFGADLDNNPSAGNKEGGLTTIAEKSLGAVAKAGNTALVDVYRYAEPVTAKGLTIMDTPGYDPASVTGMVAGGANMIVFTTGRGSCFGCKPVPSIKIATNTPMYNRMEDDMDLNAGGILQGQSIDEVGEQIFQEVLDVASGKKTKSEVHGIGEEEFIPWLVGPML